MIGASTRAKIELLKVDKSDEYQMIKLETF